MERLRACLAPDHTVERLLGSGGMGAVFLGRDVALDRPIAIKVLQPEMFTAALAARFLREAQLLAKLAPHPHIVSIHKAEPKRFNEAREIADRFKNGIPVIMNLQGTDDAVARRLVDFASGLVYGLDGKIEMVANRVYLLTPADMEVSAEERERIAGGGFYNQF